MQFDEVSFESLFHEGFRVDGASLLVHLAMGNDVRAYAERALLAELATRAFGDDLPEVSDQELRDFVMELRIRLDYMTADRSNQLVEQLGIDADALGRAIVTHLQVAKLVDARVKAANEGDGGAREGILWQAFLDASLRAHAVKAASVALLAERAEGEPSRATLDEVRDHFAHRHGSVPWRFVERALKKKWGMTDDQIDGIVSLHARAREAVGR